MNDNKDEETSIMLEKQETPTFRKKVHSLKNIKLDDKIHKKNYSTSFNIDQPSTNINSSVHSNYRSNMNYKS